MDFKKDLFLITKIRFTKAANELQQKIQKDILKTKKSDKIIIKADKTVNHYQIDVEKCHKAIYKKVNKFYKKAPNDWDNNMNNEAKK